ncbi:type IV pilus modification protein PilV [Methylocaldum sp. MU1018]
MLNGRKQRGFTLMEVLIAFLIMAIGLLGLAGLQVTGLRNDQSAFHRSQAVILAYDILDLLRANRQDARDGVYNLALGADAPTGSSRSAQDLNRWLAELANHLPQGDGAVNVANDLVTITVQWDDSRGVEAPQAFVVESQL